MPDRSSLVHAEAALPQESLWLDRHWPPQQLAIALVMTTFITMYRSEGARLTLLCFPSTTAVRLQLIPAWSLPSVNAKQTGEVLVNSFAFEKSCLTH